MRLAPSILLLIVSTNSMAAESQLNIKNTTEIIMADGVNQINNAIHKNEPIVIIKSWRANGNAHGYNCWFILGPGAGEHKNALVTFSENDGSSLKDYFTDNPFDGERVLSAVRFIRASINHETGIFAVRSTLNEAASGIPADHATATVSLYKLSFIGDSVGDTPYEFVLTKKLTTRDKYCNAEIPISNLLHLNLPENYRGPNSVDGCFPK